MGFEGRVPIVGRDVNNLILLLARYARHRTTTAGLRSIQRSQATPPGRSLSPQRRTPSVFR